MYLVSYFEDRGFIEASLGGRVSAAEVDVFAEDLMALIEGLDGNTFNLLLDYSRTKGVTGDSLQKIFDLRDKCHDLGAQKIVSVTAGEAEMEFERGFRLDHVMNGKEDFVLDPSYARFAPVRRQAAVYLRAA